MGAGQALLFHSVPNYNWLHSKRLYIQMESWLWPQWLVLFRPRTSLWRKCVFLSSRSCLCWTIRSCICNQSGCVTRRKAQTGCHSGISVWWLLIRRRHNNLSAKWNMDNSATMSDMSEWVFFFCLVLTFNFLFRWLEEVEGRSKSHWNSSWNQSTWRQHLQKLCAHQCHSQDEDQIQSFGAFLVEFKSRMMTEEGICEVWNLGLFRSKSSNWERSKFGMTCTNCSVSQRVQMFGKKKYADEM